MPALQLRTRTNERFHPRGTGGDRKHSETMDAEISLVNFLRPRRFVCEEFAVERSLGKSPARDRHGPPVGFKEEICPLVLAACIGIFQGEYAIRDDAEFFTALDRHSPPERLAFRVKRKLVFVEDF